MKTKKILSIIVLSLLVLSLPSCKDYLTEKAPGTTSLSDFYTSSTAAIESTNGCYAPLAWDYNNTYCSEWFIGDIVSDDALKGGQNISDMKDAYDMENWRTTDQNTLLLDFFNAQYQGIARCNLSIKYITPMQVGIDAEFTQQLKNRLLGEAYFLRAYYYFRLLRVFAGVPITTDVMDDSEKWGLGRASVAEVYDLILTDLEQANKLLPVRSSNQFTSADLGRATKGAAQAMLLKTNLYMASPYWQQYQGLSKDATTAYTDAKAWGDSIITSGEYDLCPNYEDNFTIAGENGIESVFEIQYAEQGTSDYGGFGFTVGTFTRILTRSRSGIIGAGWGFNHPTWNLYNEFEAGDPRRDVAILDPADPKLIAKYQDYLIGQILEKIESPTQTVIDHITDSIRTSVTTVIENISEESYCNSSALLNNKYGMYRDSTTAGGGYAFMPIDGVHDSRGALNNRQIRYADVLLMYAEACLALGDAGTALTYIDKVRDRVGLASAGAATEETLRHERRCELAMEGHRWFDLVRWYGSTVYNNASDPLKLHMDAYAAQETDEVRSQMQQFVGGKHEIFPIPQEEMQLNTTPMDQNPGY